MTDSREVVLLVHGTFAAAPEDAGLAWWQRGSSAGQSLQQRLPPGVTLESDISLFHWSGENVEWARETAAARLFERLLTFEKAQQPYHLIGHSHGGSIIWSAIKQAMRDHIELKHLRSWSTVGTPFLHFTPTTSGWWQRLWMACLIVFVFALSMQLLKLEFGVVFSLTGEQITGIEWLAIPALLFLICVDIVILAPLIYLQHKLWNVRPEVVRTVQDQQHARRAMQEYGGRWLGIWSTEDEAIRGLSHTVAFEAPLLTRLFNVRSELPFHHGDQNDKQIVVGLAEMSNLFMLPLINRVLVHFANSRLCALLAQILQGNNRPGTVVGEVSVGPVPADAQAYPPLPREIEQGLVASANEAARNVVPMLRTAFGLSVLGAQGVWQLAWGKGSGLTGKEFVHTSYFDHLGVLELLALHVAQCSGNGVASLVAASAGLRDWYGEFRQCVQKFALDALLLENNRRLNGARRHFAG